MRRLHFVVNPDAGRGRALTAWRTIQSSISASASAIGVPIHISNSFSGHPQALNHLTDDTILVSVGGDGSVHYTAREAVKRGLRFAVVAAGTGNDYARNLGLPLNLSDTLDVLLRGEEETVDVIKVNDEIVFNLAGYGIDAEVVHWIESHRWLKKVGRFGYGLVVPVVLWRHRHFQVSIRVDEGEEKTFRDVSIFAVANGALFGGGMKIAPDADPRDQELDLVFASGLSKLAILKLFPKIYQGTHITHPGVKCLRGRRFEVQFTGSKTAAEYDGEPYPLPLTAKIEVVPELRLLVPRRAATLDQGL